MRPLIFLADDDALIRSLVELRLGIDGYEVQSAADGVAALQRLSRISPALIILDLGMPRMGGVAVLKTMLADSNLPKGPVMMLTASRDAADVKAAKGLGIVAYLLKPFAPDVLSRRVRRILGPPGAYIPVPATRKSAAPAFELDI